MRASAKGLDRSVAVSVRVHRTDKVDAHILVRPLATDFLSGSWPADERAQMLRRVTMRRAHLMRQCIRAKNQIHSVLHRNLLPVSDPRGNTVQSSPPFISTNDEVRQLMAALDTVLSAQEAK